MKIKTKTDEEKKFTFFLGFNLRPSTHLIFKGGHKSSFIFDLNTMGQATSAKRREQEIKGQHNTSCSIAD